MQIYLAYVNSDSTEGRGHDVLVGAFKNLNDALSVVKGRGPMGASDGELSCITLYESLHEYDSEKKSEIRRKAMQKLTEEEQLALGLITHTRSDYDAYADYK